MRQVDIKDFEDYQITDDGRVWSKKTNKWMILQTNKKNGYLYVGIMKNGKRHLKSIHRLVAEAFIQNQYNKPCIDHINTIRTDNRVENLRWCSHKENMNNENSVIQMKKSHTGDKNWNYGIHWPEEVKRKIAEAQSKKSLLIFPHILFMCTSFAPTTSRNISLAITISTTIHC